MLHLKSLERPGLFHATELKCAREPVFAVEQTIEHTCRAHIIQASPAKLPSAKRRHHSRCDRTCNAERRGERRRLRDVEPQADRRCREKADAQAREERIDREVPMNLPADVLHRSGDRVRQDKRVTRWLVVGVVGLAHRGSRLLRSDD
jgi:hypothetical protein